MLIEGLFVPLTTPFMRDGSLYLQKLKANMRRYSLAPVAGLVALSGVGESEALTETEIEQVLRAVSEAALPEKILLAAVACESVKATLDRIALMADCGFDVAIVSIPKGLLPDETEILRFIRDVAESSALPVLLWSRVDVSFSAPIVADAATHEKVLGVLDDQLDLTRLQALGEVTRGAQRTVTVTNVFAPVTRRMQAQQTASSLLSAEILTSGSGKATSSAPPVRTRAKSTGFALVSGRNSDILSLLQAGAAGVMPTLAACAPQACFEVYAAFKDGDPALAALKEQRIVAASEALGRRGVAAVKYACDRNGYYGGIPRMPQLPLLAVQRDEIDAVFAGIPS